MIREDIELKLNEIDKIKSDLMVAIQTQGKDVDTSTPFSEYSKKIDEIKIPNYLYSISGSFSGEIGDVVFNDNIEYIPPYTGIYMPFITSITMSDKVEAMGDYCFAGLVELEPTKLTLSKALNRIGDACFVGRPISLLIVKNKTPPALGQNVFSGSFSEFTEIQVPIESLDIYKNTGGWAEFAKYMVGV